jgi:hypothetical protein
VLPTVIAAAAAVTVAAFGIVVLVATHHDNVVPRGATNPPSPTAAAGAVEPVSPPPIPAAALPPNARVCPTRLHRAGDYTKSAAGTSVTSCEFAEAVRVAYGRSGPPSPIQRVINAFSPVTGKWYPMTCVANETLVTCSGGNGAVVYAY